MKRIYEIINECKAAKTFEERVRILHENDSITLREIIFHTYHPKFKFYITGWPKNYKKPDTLPGVSMTNLYTEFRRLYLFRIGDPIADSMTSQKRELLLTQTLEGMEPEEAQVFIDILSGDLKVPGFNAESLNLVFPGVRLFF